MEKDFSKPRPQIAFTIDGDRFQAASALPGETLVTFAARFTGEEKEDRTIADQMAEFKAALELVLLPDSYELFVSRMRDQTRPIDAEQVSEVIMWLLEQYGARPTQPSSPSAVGQVTQEPGTNLTGTVLPVESISAPSLHPAF